MDHIFQASAKGVRMTTGRISLAGDMAIDYRLDGQARRLTPSFPTAKTTSFSDGVDKCSCLMESAVRQEGLIIRRQIALDPADESIVRLRMCVLNGTGCDIWLDRMTLLRLQAPETLFPGVDSRNWVVMR